MREMITKVYNFNELSDEAKEKAIEAHRFDFCDAWSWENWASIRTIAKTCFLEVVSNNYNDTGFSRFAASSMLIAARVVLRSFAIAATSASAM